MCVICMEGLDRCGKSTQIEKIKNYFKEKGIETSVIHYSGIEVQESGPFKQGAQYVASRARYDDMLRLADEMSDAKHVVIFDRAHLGEMVYSPLYRKYDGEYVFELEQKYQNLLDKVFLFVVIDTPEHLLAREDGLSLSNNIEDKQKEIDRFKKAFGMSNIKHKELIDISDKSIEDVWAIIKQKLETL